MAASKVAHANSTKQAYSAETLNSVAHSRANLLYDMNTNSSYTRMRKRHQRGSLQSVYEICNFIWNPSTREFLGRTWRNWLTVLVLLFVLYGFLTLFLAGSLGLYLYTFIMEDYPRLTGEQSLLQMNPALGIVPQPSHLTALIRFRISKGYSYRPLADAIVAFTQSYEPEGQSADLSGSVYENCYSRHVDPSEFVGQRKVCKVDLRIGGRCVQSQEFGYDEGMPCFALTMNRIYGWLPEPLENATGVMVRCEGVNDMDKDAIGPICYHDDDDYRVQDQCKKDHGVFKSYYFPFLKQVNYMSPVVFMELMSPRMNVVIMVQCKLYAKNINVDAAHGEGSVRFQLLVDQ